MKLRPFDVALIAFFGTLFVLALILLRSHTPAASEDATALSQGVEVWGTLPDTTFNNLLSKIRETNNEYNKVTYRYITPETFDATFLNALADQTGPDLILLPQDRFVEHRSRLQPIPYESLPIRDFRSSYIDGAEIFALNDGIYAIPVAVDPLVMYWNRDMFASSGLLSAPKTWEEVVGNIVPTLTTRDFNRNIKRSGIAMGEYNNIKNAFPSLSLLLLQGGSSMVAEEYSNYKIKLNESQSGGTGEPFTKSVAFFTNFSNTSNTLYSWNRSLRLDRDMFLSEDLGLYFGFASEGREIAAMNPNLSFDIAEVPQGQASTVKRTYGLFYGFSIPKNADNKAGAMIAMSFLGSPANAKTLADGYGFAPTVRTSLEMGSNDVYGRIAYTSAVYARAWLNPDKDKLDGVFNLMLEDINANRRSINSAAYDATSRLQQIY